MLFTRFIPQQLTGTTGMFQAKNTFMDCLGKRQSKKQFNLDVKVSFNVFLFLENMILLFIEHCFHSEGARLCNDY